MPEMSRFAGYQSPAEVVADTALTREQKLTALIAWRSTLRRLGLTGQRPALRTRLIGELEDAIERASVAE